MSSGTWIEWIWGNKKPKPARATDAAHDTALRAHFHQLLDHTEPPNSFKASEVAQLLTPKELFKLGYDEWQEAMPAILELAWELREFGDCEILQKGKVLGRNVDMYEVEGGFRIRRKGV